MWPLSSNRTRTGVLNASAGRGYRRQGGVSRGGRGGSARRREARVVSVLSFALGGIVLAAALGGLAVGGHLKGATTVAAASIDRLTASAGFGIAHVVVVGRKETDRRAIVEALDVTIGSSLLAYDCRAARQRLLMLGWVDEARIRRILPGTLQVEILEKVPLAIWQIGGKLVLIDKSGDTIAAVQPGDLERYPHVVGSGAERHAAALLETLKRFPDLESRVRAAIRVGDRRWDLALANGINVALPADNVEAALSQLMTLDKKLSLLSRDITAIDLRFGDRLVVRVPGGGTEIVPGTSRET